jgi:uncharacterized membrane protein YfcA
VPEFGSEIWIIALAVTLIAGAVKGLVGFAMPMIMISGFATVVPSEQAVAFLILPTLVTNAWQALRGGITVTVAVARKHWRYLMVLWIAITLSAQLVTTLRDSTIFLLIGIPVAVLAMLQLVGWRPRIAMDRVRFVEAVVAAFAGFIGGLSGVWGPPTTMYLTALDIQKTEHVKLQGIIYGSGALVLMASHLQSGALTRQTGLASALMVVPALIGMAIGFRLHDRIDQALFRRLTLIMLVIAGLSLVWRGLIGK